MKTKLLFASLLVSGAAWAQTSITPFIMKAPNDYYIVGASSNGKWACGVYQDDSNEEYGFLWNLESGEIEMLDPSNPSEAFAVSDDGVVVGHYTDNTYKSNGASVILAGYWKDHKWNRLELPNDSVAYAHAYSISPDGHYISGVVQNTNVKMGTINIGEVYAGYVWKDGKIDRMLTNQKGCSMPYAISPDGKYVAGWVQGDINRQGCLWEADNTITYLSDSNAQSIWNSGRKFSPDGKKLLYFDTWKTFDGKYGINAIYNMDTRTSTPVFPLDDEGSFDFFDISNAGTVMAENNLRGYIYQNGQGYFADEYLTARGINLADEHVLKTAEADYYQIFRASTVSADDNIMGFQYYNDDKDASGNYSVSVQSMIVKFNQATTGLVPVSVKATQMSGLSSVYVSWKPNVTAKGITGYNVYRDGVKINTELVSSESFIDANVANGEHKYTVSAVYGTDESDKSTEVAMTVNPQALSTPRGLFAQQHGYNNAYLEWSNPSTNFASLSYYDVDNANIETWGLGTNNVSYEAAILFDKSKTSAYKGQKITSVGFYPLEEQGGWKINLYTHDENGALKLLYTQPVTQEVDYGKFNTVRLNTPQDVPAGDLLIAVEVAVKTASSSINAYDNSKATKGYTDLIRLSTENNFYSLGEMFESEYYLMPVNWPISATISPVDADLTKDVVDHYNVYADNQLLGNTKENDYIVSSLEKGSHTLGVSAVYSNGSESDVHTTSINIIPNASQLKAINNVSIAQGSNTSINATWEAPHDNVQLQYCSNVSSGQGVTAPEENNYGIMVGALYPSKTFRGREGYKITSFRFYPLADASFTAYIYKNDVQIDKVDIDNYTLGKWNEVAVTSPIDVDSKASYQLVIDCYDVTPESPAIAVDNGPAVSGYSDIYSLDGESWNPISSSGVYANWMIGLNLENTKSTQLPIDGYDVTIDGEKKNNEKLTTNSFNYDFGKEDAVEHTINVDVYYTVSPKSVKGGITRFYIGAAGINENTIERIDVRQGNNEITVDGDNVTSVNIFSTDGATVASAKGNTVSINNINAGIYVVKAVVNGETIVRKIMIAK